MLNIATSTVKCRMSTAVVLVLCKRKIMFRPKIFTFLYFFKNLSIAKSITLLQSLVHIRSYFSRYFFRILCENYGKLRRDTSPSVDSKYFLKILSLTQFLGLMIFNSKHICNKGPSLSANGRHDVTDFTFHVMMRNKKPLSIPRTQPSGFLVVRN